MLLEMDALSAADRQRAIIAIEDEVQALQALVHDVRAAGLEEREGISIDRRPIPLPPLIDRAIAYARALPGEHPVERSAVPDLDVWADPVRIAQVLRNLLENAAKYSDIGTPIALQTTERNGRLRITVADHGTGIPPHDLDRVFEKFDRGTHPANKSIQGTGLGLYIAQRIIVAHGSELKVRSRLGEGSRLSFELETVT
jgi:signal transduction histidine kinase